jgi:hypothetical protein
MTAAAGRKDVDAQTYSGLADDEADPLLRAIYRSNADVSQARPTATAAAARACSPCWCAAAAGAHRAGPPRRRAGGRPGAEVVETTGAVWSAPLPEQVDRVEPPPTTGSCRACRPRNSSHVGWASHWPGTVDRHPSGYGMICRVHDSGPAVGRSCKAWPRPGNLASERRKPVRGEGGRGNRRWMEPGCRRAERAVAHHPVRASAGRACRPPARLRRGAQPAGGGRWQSSTASPGAARWGSSARRSQRRGRRWSDRPWSGRRWTG